MSQVSSFFEVNLWESRPVGESAAWGVSTYKVYGASDWVGRQHLQMATG